MHDNDVDDDKDGVNLLTVYAFVTSMEPKTDDLQTTVHAFIYRQANHSYFYKRHGLQVY